MRKINFRRRRRLQRSSGNVSFSEDNEKTIQLVGAEFRLEYFDWPTISTWLSYFGVRVQIDEPLPTDSEDMKRHKRNNLKVCHVNGEKSLVCFDRAHVPSGVRIGQETDEKLDTASFKFQLIYRAVIPYNNYYMVYTGNDPSNRKDRLWAKCHTNAIDQTNYGSFRRNYNVHTSYTQSLHYYHHPHPDLKLMTGYEIEGTWILAHVFGKLLNVGMNFAKPTDKDEDSTQLNLGMKPFIILNSRVNLLTTQPEVIERLLMQAFRILFNSNVQLAYNEFQDKFNLNVF